MKMKKACQKHTRIGYINSYPCLNESTHTPTPWTITTKVDRDGFVQILCEDNENPTIAYDVKPENAAYAANASAYTVSDTMKIKIIEGNYPLTTLSQSAIL